MKNSFKFMLVSLLLIIVIRAYIYVYMDFQRKYKELFPEDEAKISILNEVNLMTPENIHINSFMYEPILDMSNIHLKELYREIKGL